MIRPTTIAEKHEGLPINACNVAILYEHCHVKRPYLMYYEEAIDGWCLVPEKVEQMISTENLSVGDDQELRFKCVEMTDHEYENLAED
tara:strand:- start:598 stop:861 length:264 start_codon:yes stop_codon:yes gene_type:complete